MTWHFDLATDIGGRADQQDRAEVFVVPGRTDEFLVILADGMGGQQQGAAAAQAVIDTARRRLPEAAGSNPRQFLTELCLEAHRTIRAIGQQHDTNPASTCTALYVRGDEAYWIHVGDSRLYHFEADRLLSRTRDHTVAELVGEQAGAESGEAQRGADHRLYMCLGGQNELQPEFGASAVGKDDWFMLCSDGFWNQVSADEAASFRPGSASAGTRAADLATMATRRAGSDGDNVSLVMATPRLARSDGVWRRLFMPGLRFGS